MDSSSGSPCRGHIGVRGETESDVPEARELPVVTLVTRGQTQRVPGLQSEVKGPGAQGGDPAGGLEVAGPVLGGLDPLAVDINEGLK